MALYTEANDIYTVMNKASLAQQNNSAWWSKSGTQLNSTLSSSSTAYKKAMYEYDSKKGKYGSLKYISGSQSLYHVQKALDLQTQYSNTTIGKTN